MVEFRFRRGTASQWAIKNPVLGPGEPGYETDTRKTKVGDGSTPWNSLSYNFTGGGGAGDNAFVFTQASPLASWTVPNTLERLPSVTLYVDGEQVEADVTATISQVLVSWPYPVAGIAVLT